MAIVIGSKTTLKILYLLAWIFFVGICIEAGAFMVNAIGGVFLDAATVGKLWREVDLTALYQYDAGHFSVQMLLMGIAAILRALLFYAIIKILHDQKFDMKLPFNSAVLHFLYKAACLSVAIALFSIWGVQYSQWLAGKGIPMPDTEALRLGGADVWLFMGVTLLVVAQLFKRGIEIQLENELTV